jgi:hypothetical protein
MAGESEKQTQGKCISLDYLCVRFTILGVLFISGIAIHWIRKGLNAPSVYGAMIGIATGALLSIFMLAILNRSAKKGEFVLRSRLTGLQFLARFILIVAIGGILVGVILGTIWKYYSLSDADAAIFCITWGCGSNGALGLLYAFGALSLQRHYGKKFYLQGRKGKSLGGDENDEGI